MFYLAAWDIEVSPPLVVMHACFSLIFYGKKQLRQFYI